MSGWSNFTSDFSTTFFLKVERDAYQPRVNLGLRIKDSDVALTYPPSNPWT